MWTCVIPANATAMTIPENMNLSVVPPSDRNKSNAPCRRSALSLLVNACLREGEATTGERYWRQKMTGTVGYELRTFCISFSLKMQPVPQPAETALK